MKEFTITKEWEGARLDRFIRHIYPDLNFTEAQILLRKGTIRVNGKKHKGSFRLSAGDLITIEAEIASQINQSGLKPGDTTPHKLPSEIGKKIPIIYEDSDILAIDKPAGIPVQPGNRKEKGSLLDSIKRYEASKPADRHKGEISFHFTPVHRLDFETTGLLLIAKTRKAAVALSKAFREGKIEKYYLAVVEGVPEPPEGTIKNPLKVVTTGKAKKVKVLERKRTTKSRSTKDAITNYKVLRIIDKNSSLVRISISHGRTHQIRVHLAYIGIPIVGDKKYGQRRLARETGRLYLHCYRLSFVHPSTGEKLSLQCKPPWLEKSGITLEELEKS